MRDEKKECDLDGTVAEDDFWASILKETMDEADRRMGESEPPEDDWDVLLDEAMAEAESRMGESGQPAPEDDGETASEEGETAPEEPSPYAVSVVTGPLSIRPGETLLDTYRVESDVIGKGGMGAVWKVHHEGWNADLAMKRPKPSAFQTEKQKQDFARECESWINLGLHPNIVSCYYVREIDGVPTIFSEWMDNGDLETHIKNGTLYDGTGAEVRERLLDVAVQFARGLRYAHENNLVHRDVKPDNLLLTKNWEAKVSDFGISQARAALSSTETGQSDGDPNATQAAPGGRAKTPAYCSPEQAEERPLTRRTDIYSWAVSVLEMYLGSKPWAHGGQITGPVAGLLCRDYFEMCKERPIPEALRELLAKCLEQEPDDRPHDFEEVEAALAQIYKTETGADYPRPEPKAAADTPDSLNNRAISYLDLGKEEEAVRLLESCARQSHFDGTLNLALYRWRKGVDSDESMHFALDTLERFYPQQHDEIARIRRQVYLEGCGLTEPPAFRTVIPTGYFFNRLSSMILCGGELAAVVRKRWKDGKVYNYVCRFDIETGELIEQIPGDGEQPGILFTMWEGSTELYDNGRRMYVSTSRSEENGLYDVLRQQRIKKKPDKIDRTDDSFIEETVCEASEFFARSGEIQPEFQDNIPLIGKKGDGKKVFAIVRTATRKICARIVADRLDKLNDGQYLIWASLDAVRLYDAADNSDLLLLKRGRQAGKVVLRDPSKRVVITRTDRRSESVFEYEPGRFAMGVYGRCFTIPELRELEIGGWKERTEPQPCRVDFCGGEMSVRELATKRELLTLKLPELPTDKGTGRADRMVTDRDGRRVVVYLNGYRVAWAVLDLDFYPPVRPQMSYRVTTPVSSGRALAREETAQRRLSAFRSAESDGAIERMIAVYREAVGDKNTDDDTLRAMNAVLSARCAKRGLLRVIGAPTDAFREMKTPSLLKELGGIAVAPDGCCYVSCEEGESGQSEVRRWDYPACRVGVARRLDSLSNDVKKYYNVHSLCVGPKEEVYLSYTCGTYTGHYGSFTDNHDLRVACLGAGLDRDDTLLFVPGGCGGKIFLPAVTEDGRFLLLCRDGRASPLDTVTLELLDLASGEIVYSASISHLVKEAEAFRHDDTLRMLCGRDGAMELLWDYDPVPVNSTAPASPPPSGMQIENGVLIRYLGEDGKDEAHIPDGVVEIGPEAFKGCVMLRAVTVPEGVCTIGESAFKGCIRLERVDILSHALESVGEAAFSGCVRLRDLRMVENRLRVIEKLLFSGCERLESIDIPESVREIGSSAFSHSGLKACRFPAGLQSIGTWAFTNTKLAQAELPPQLSALGEEAFRECPLRTIRIPAAVDTLPEGIFRDCRHLESVENEGSIRTIEKEAFSGCASLKSVQVAYGAAFDRNYIFVDPFWPSKYAPEKKEVRIKEPTVIRGRTWDSFQRKSVSLCKVLFTPVPRETGDGPEQAP